MSRAAELRQPPRRSGRHLVVCATLGVGFVLWAGAAQCQRVVSETSASATTPVPLTPVIVDAPVDDAQHLSQQTDTGSRLGLTARETPATIETRDQIDLEVRGLRTTKEALADITGATVGNVPGNPAAVSLRGFSGNAITVLQDGVRVAASTLVVRDLDTWAYERVEVLKGPSSVLYGEGALGGTINLVTKKPTLAGANTEALASVGSFATRRLAVDLNRPLSPTMAARVDVSYVDSDSYYDVRRQDTHALSVNASVLYQPNDQWSALVALDHQDDYYGSTYQGTPLLPYGVARHPSNAVESTNGWVIDRSIRRLNYNPDGAHSGAVSDTLRWNTTWHPGGEWTLSHDGSLYKADRSFVVSGDQIYNPSTTAFDRTLQRVTHDHRFWTERLLAVNDMQFGRFRNRWSLGAETSGTRFTNPRQSGTGSAVDPFQPLVGVFPSADSRYWPGTGRNVTYRSRLRTTAAFLEDAFNLTPGWLVLAGARYERINLHRTSDDRNTATVQRFHPTFRPFSWRVGTTYSVLPSLQLFAQHATAVTPVSSLLIVAQANGSFDLSHGKTDEVGLKWATADGRQSLMASYYRITLSDILTRDPQDPQLTVQGGRQSSRGAELTWHSRIGQGWTLDAGVAYVDARYDELTEAGGLDRRGNRPVNIPRTTVNASALYRLRSRPLTIGLFVRQSGAFYSDTANDVRVRGHTVVDASAQYDWARGTLTARVRNLGNALYGEYSGYSAGQIYLGAPRSVELAWHWRL